MFKGESCRDSTELGPIAASLRFDFVEEGRYRHQALAWGRPFIHNEVAPGSQNFSALLIVGGKASENHG